MSAAATSGRISTPETAFYSTIVEAARVTGWRVHHQRSTINGTPIQGDAGFPDFVLVHPRGHVLFVEIKADRRAAVLTPAQRDWATALVEAGARWYEVRVPSGLDAFLQLITDLALVP